MKNDDHNDMSMDQQIKYYEDCISRLEESKKTISGDCTRICLDLEKAYQQVALLKIRKMMDMPT